MIVADRTVCIGAAICSLTAPDMFDQDAVHGLVVILREPRNVDEMNEVGDAVDSCPSGALEFLDDELPSLKE